MRSRIEPTDDWHQLSLLVQEPVQRTYELIRPVVLFGQSPAERARQTGTAERTIYRQAARFEAQGMAGLLPPPATPQPRRLPEAIRQAILDLKAEHPPLRQHEIARIVAVRFDYPVSHHTVKRIVTAEVATEHKPRRFPPYHQIPDPAERRLAIIRLHSEGWTVTAIAAMGSSNATTAPTIASVCGSTARPPWSEHGRSACANTPPTRPRTSMKWSVGAIAAARCL